VDARSQVAALLTALAIGGERDHDGDGEAEIASLSLVVEAGASADAGAPAVLVWVEDRLLERDELGPVLEMYAADLAAEGWRVRVERASLHRGDRHQDGRTLLALREELRARAAADPAFAGVVLVGAFPEAYLVRNVNWRKKTPLTVRRGTPNEKTFRDAVPYLRTVPEGVAHTCDLVLADLDGRWGELYAQPRERLPTVTAVFPGGVPDRGGITPDFDRGHVTFEDFFHVNDGHLDVREVLGDDDALTGLHVIPRDGDSDGECAPADLERPNRIARPEISVSRINARGVADDLEHELALLTAYFARNHAYRTGAHDVPHRPASLAHDLRSGYGVVTRASSRWEDADPGSLDIHGKPTLDDARDWFARPAVLRTIRAHSDRWGSQLEKGKLDAKVMRRLFDDGVTGNGASFYLHTGCEAISPAHAERRPWHHSDYGRANGAAATFFFGDGLALIGRAKVFYDEPPGFCEALAAGKTVGDAWRGTFEIESKAASWREVGGDIGRKRTYFWSLLGDWTLRLRAP